MNAGLRGTDEQDWDGCTREKDSENKEWFPPPGIGESSNEWSREEGEDALEWKVLKLISLPPTKTNTHTIPYLYSLHNSIL